MRPSQIRLSDAPTGKAYMGWWGNMGGPKQKGIVQYGLSPFRQRAMAGAFSGYIFGGYKRIASHLPYVTIPFALGYGIYAWAKSYDAWQSSKAGHIALMAKDGGHH